MVIICKYNFVNLQCRGGGASPLSTPSCILFHSPTLFIFLSRFVCLCNGSTHKHSQILLVTLPALRITYQICLVSLTAFTALLLND